MAAGVACASHRACARTRAARWLGAPVAAAPRISHSASSTPPPCAACKHSPRPAAVAKAEAKNERSSYFGDGGLAKTGSPATSYIALSASSGLASGAAAAAAAAAFCTCESLLAVPFVFCTPAKLVAAVAWRGG
eukprot:366130-Chlamydomonas_euryale.AAC.49